MPWIEHDHADVGALERRLGQVEAVERGQRHGALLGREHAQQGCHQRAPVQSPDEHIRQDIEPLHQVELLEDHGAAHAPVAQRAAAQRGHVRAVEQHATRGGVRQAVQHAQQGGLARARAPDHAHHLPRRHGERDGVDGRLVAKAACQPLDLEHVRPVPS